MRLAVAKTEKSISVLGATGFTGRLIAERLRDQELPLLLAGRNAEKLKGLSQRLGGAQTMVVDVRDANALDTLARRSQVLINCVGPFVDFGEPVVRAAIAAGSHYLDTTGEQPFVKAILVHDTWAAAQNVAVVPALAFEIAVADCGAALAVDSFDEVDDVRVTYVTQFHASQGTKRTLLRMLQSSGFAWVDGEWVEEAPARRIEFVDLPEPVGRVAAVSFPSAEVITIPRHVAAREVRTFISLPRIAARILSASGPAVQGLARTPLVSLLERLVGDGTDGPDEATRRRDTFHVLIEVRGTRRGKTARQRLLLRGRDPYGLTAAIARQGAMLMASGRIERRGVVTPATAFKPKAFLEALEGEGLSYDTIAS
jgi:short subunit dehydrogenase-like uncharacterized protein